MKTPIISAIRSWVWPCQSHNEIMSSDSYQLGYYRTDEQEKFEVALKMAKEQGVALSDVNIAHLEFLLTESK